MAAIDGPAGPSMATRSAIDGPARPVMAGDHLRRDRSNSATKSKETRNKILAQVNTKDSGKR